MKKAILFLSFFAGFLVIVGAGCNSSAPNNINDDGNLDERDITTTVVSVKTFDVSGVPFKFNPTELRVKKGDTIKINFTNLEGLHDFVIDEFSVRTPQIKAGETASVEFVADKIGTFEYYCSVGDHRVRGMVGKLVVE